MALPGGLRGGSGTAPPDLVQRVFPALGGYKPRTLGPWGTTLTAPLPSQPVWAQVSSGLDQGTGL